MPTRSDHGSDAPLLALGMVIAPSNEAKRALVRRTMLQARCVLDGSVVFRFLVGCAAGGGCRRESRPLREDTLALPSLDGPEVASHGPHCACTEKTFDWMQHALRTWPTAAFFGKTEDDTYVHLDGLAQRKAR